MTEQYPEHVKSDFVYTPFHGSQKYTTECGHDLRFSPNTKIVIICPDCLKDLELLLKKDSRMKKVVTEEDVKVVKAMADKDIKKQKATDRRRQKATREARAAKAVVDKEA